MSRGVFFKMAYTCSMFLPRLTVKQHSSRSSTALRSVPTGFTQRMTDAEEKTQDDSRGFPGTVFVSDFHDEAEENGVTMYELKKQASIEACMGKYSYHSLS